MIKVVGTMIFKDGKLLIDKPHLRNTYQMIGGGLEEGETPLEGAIRECHEELGPNIKFDESKFELIMEFNEVATSDGVTPIYFYVFKYNGNIEGEDFISDEIESYLWYDSSMGDEMLSNTLKNEVVPYCIKNNLIK